MNPLDVACKEHDIAYSKNREKVEARNEADKVLASKAWKRVFAGDSSIGERATAYAVTNAMNLKYELGMGLRKTGRKKKRAKRDKVSLKKVVNAASRAMVPGRSAREVIYSALRGAPEAVKKTGGRSNLILPRTLPVPAKVGGFLPFLVPIFAGLSAAGAIASGTSGIAEPVSDARAAVSV